MTFTAIPMNAARICDGLSKIGYTPPSAICDIIDNSVRAKAKNVYVLIERERDLSDARTNNVKEYLIIDDGAGMDRNSMQNALALGSIDDYEPHSLSKFGLGLKSASFSQGEVLELVSSSGNMPFSKFVVSLPEIRRRAEYGAEETELSAADEQLIARYLCDGHGTIVRVASVRKINHPSIKSTLDELRMKVGAIYYYLMRDQAKNDRLHIFIDGEECQPFDVLFTDQANLNGNLDENTWDGRTTRWIEKPTKVTVDAEMGVNVTIEVTQLPHPPTFEREGPGRQKQIRDQYNIGAGQYGYYVYRNHRLLSWAESFGMIPQDQDFYAFRGRIIMDDTADEVFNIDVKKSQIHLSDEAEKVLNDYSDEYKKKSKKAWARAKQELKRIANEEGLARANTLASQVTVVEELPGASDSEEAFREAKRREQEILEEQHERIKDLVIQGEEEGGSASPIGGNGVALEPTPEQIQEAVADGPAAPTDKIFMVRSTQDNALWEPHYDTDKGTCVRVNRLHRFARVIYEDNRNNGSMHIFLGLLLLQLANAEIYVQKKFDKYKRSQIEDILQEFRRVCTELLAQLCREVGDSLPNDD